MKSNRKTRIIILLILGIFFAFSPIFITNIRFTVRDRDITSNYDDKFNHNNLKISAVSGKIHIDGNSGWAAFRAAGNCTGSGNYTHPYIIEDKVVDGSGSGSCIVINNSNVYFRIENCTVYNSGGFEYPHPKAGIQLNNVTRGTLVLNNCTNNYRGIHLKNCNNNTISGNTANNNFAGISLGDSENNTISGNSANINAAGISLGDSENNTVSGNTANENNYGIHLGDSENNTISGNTANENNYGIALFSSYNNTISGNIMNKCGLEFIIPSLEMLLSNKIDTTNLVNGKPLYYYTNEVNLGVNDFINAGQVILVNVTNSLISNLNVSYSSEGISLYYCNNNMISGNIANNNLKGIGLSSSNNNTISGNTANNNTYGIDSGGDDNTISGNTANNNVVGISLGNCNSCIILGNTVNNNNYGISISSIYPGNIIYLNNFLSINKNLDSLKSCEF